MTFVTLGSLLYARIIWGQDLVTHLRCLILKPHLYNSHHSEVYIPENSIIKTLSSKKLYHQSFAGQPITQGSSRLNIKPSVNRYLIKVQPKNFTMKTLSSQKLYHLALRTYEQTDVRTDVYICLDHHFSDWGIQNIRTETLNVLKTICTRKAYIPKSHPVFWWPFLVQIEFEHPVAFVFWKNWEQDNLLLKFSDFDLKN